MDAIRTAQVLHDCEKELARHYAKEYPSDCPPIPCIPVDRYTSQEMWDLERQHIWRASWLCAGHVDELPNNGSYKLWREAKMPVVLVRGKDSKIRAFFNSCKHRGGPLVTEAAGKVSVLACKFHCWTYDLTGKLTHVPDKHEFAQLDISVIGLNELRCELWGNFIFVNPNPNAEPLMDCLGPVAKDFTDFKMDTRRVYHTTYYDIPSNWKLAVESNIEAYHVPRVHPNTVNQIIDHRGVSTYLYPKGHSLMVLPRKTGEAAKAANLLTLDRDSQSSVDPEHEISNHAVRNYFVFPNLLISAAEFQFPILLYWPLDIRTTRWQVLFTAPPGYDDPQSAECQMEIQGFDVALKEDIASLCAVQESYEQQLISEARISCAERRITHFQEAIDRAVGVERLPDTCRMGHAVEGLVVDPYGAAQAL